MCKCARTCAHTHICVKVDICESTCITEYMCKRTCTCAYKNIYIYIHIYGRAGWITREVRFAGERRTHASARAAGPKLCPPPIFVVDPDLLDNFAGGPAPGSNPECRVTRSSAIAASPPPLCPLFASLPYTTVTYIRYGRPKFLLGRSCYRYRYRSSTATSRRSSAPAPARPPQMFAVLFAGFHPVPPSLLAAAPPTNASGETTQTDCPTY